MPAGKNTRPLHAELAAGANRNRRPCLPKPLLPGYWGQDCRPFLACRLFAPRATPPSVLLRVQPDCQRRAPISILRMSFQPSERLIDVRQRAPIENAI